MRNTLTPEPEDKERLVVFVGGFDPRGARYYHQLFVEQAARQAKVDGTSYTVSARQPLNIEQEVGGVHRHATWRIEEVKTTDRAGCGAVGSEYVFFEWGDQVRAYWPRSTSVVWGQAFHTYLPAFKDWQLLSPLKKQVPFTLLTFAYPLLFAALVFLIALGAAIGGVSVTDAPNAALSLLIAIAVFALVMFLGFSLDKWLHVSWLLRIFNFGRLCTQEDMTALDVRIKSMAQWISAKQMQQPQREIVVVGFSVGSVLATRLIDELLAKEPLKAGSEATSHTPLTLVTLGNCIPLFSRMPAAHKFRALLQRLGTDARFYWADISSPGDSVSFGMCDLLDLSLRGLALVPEKWVNAPRMCSPRFHKLFDAKTYQGIRYNKMRMHFQYLMATQKKGAYSYFAMLTARGSVREFVEKNLVR